MSGLIGGALPVFILRAKDDRLHPAFRGRHEPRRRGYSRHDALGFDSAYSGFWPGNRGGFMGDLGADVSMLQESARRRVERPGAGVASRVGFPGVTRDEFGTPLAGVTVVLHRTATREFIHELVSDANGNYLMQSVYAGEGHYIYFHKPGAPNRWATTDNNLLGA